MINGDRVKQAREIRGLRQGDLAQRVRIAQSAIARIEAGTLSPSEVTESALALALGFPMRFFRQENAPEFPVGSLYYRAQIGVRARDRDMVRQHARTTLEIIGRLENQVERKELRLPRADSDPITGAALARSTLGLSPDGPIPNLIRVLEMSGVVVVPCSEPVEGLDAFSVWAGRERLRPVIVYSSNTTGDRIRFSIAHELGHLVMHRAPVFDVTKLEEEANTFASEFLSPANSLQQEIETPVSLESLARLKPRWGISVQALIRRAFSLRKITERQYRYLMQKISSCGWRTREPENLDVPIELPRALRQMAELVFGIPIDYKRACEELALPAQLTKAIMELYLGKSGARAIGEPNKSAVSKSIVNLAEWPDTRSR